METHYLLSLLMSVSMSLSGGLWERCTPRAAQLFVVVARKGPTPTSLLDISLCLVLRTDINNAHNRGYEGTVILVHICGIVQGQIAYLGVCARVRVPAHACVCACVPACVRACVRVRSIYRDRGKACIVMCFYKEDACEAQLPLGDLWFQEVYHRGTQGDGTSGFMRHLIGTLSPKGVIRLFAGVGRLAG